RASTAALPALAPGRLTLEDDDFLDVAEVRRGPFGSFGVVDRTEGLEPGVGVERRRGVGTEYLAQRRNALKADHRHATLARALRKQVRQRLRHVLPRPTDRLELVEDYPPARRVVVRLIEQELREPRHHRARDGSGGV